MVLLNIFSWIGKILEETLMSKIMAAFPRDLMMALEGGPGIVTRTRPCGCVVTAEHIPEKNIWIFTLDYSHCQSGERKRT